MSVNGILDVCWTHSVLKIPKDPHVRACIDASIQQAKPDSGDSPANMMEKHGEALKPKSIPTLQTTLSWNDFNMQVI